MNKTYNVYTVQKIPGTLAYPDYSAFTAVYTRETKNDVGETTGRIVEAIPERMCIDLDKLYQSAYVLTSATYRDSTWDYEVQSLEPPSFKQVLADNRAKAQHDAYKTLRELAMKGTVLEFQFDEAHTPFVFKYSQPKQCVFADLNDRVDFEECPEFVANRVPGKKFFPEHADYTVKDILELMNDSRTLDNLYNEITTVLNHTEVLFALNKGTPISRKLRRALYNRLSEWDSSVTVCSAKFADKPIDVTHARYGLTGFILDAVKRHNKFAAADYTAFDVEFESFVKSIAGFSGTYKIENLLKEYTKQYDPSHTTHHNFRVIENTATYAREVYSSHSNAELAMDSIKAVLNATELENIEKYAEIVRAHASLYGLLDETRWFRHCTEYTRESTFYTECIEELSAPIKLRYNQKGKPKYAGLEEEPKLFKDKYVPYVKSKLVEYEPLDALKHYAQKLKWFYTHLTEDERKQFYRIGWDICPECFMPYETAKGCIGYFESKKREVYHVPPVEPKDAFEARGLVSYGEVRLPVKQFVAIDSAPEETMLKNSYSFEIDPSVNVDTDYDAIDVFVHYESLDALDDYGPADDDDVIDSDAVSSTDDTKDNDYEFIDNDYEAIDI